MIIMIILSLLLSNAVILRRDISILFNRIVIIALIYCILHDTMSLSIISRGVGLHGGLIYFLLGGFSSCFIFLGACLLWANSGTIIRSPDFIFTKWYCIFHCFLLGLGVCETTSTSLNGLHITIRIQSRINYSIINPLCTYSLKVFYKNDTRFCTPLNYRVINPLCAYSTTSLNGLYITYPSQSRINYSIINPLFKHFNSIHIKMVNNKLLRLSMGAILDHVIYNP